MVYVDERRRAGCKTDAERQAYAEGLEVAAQRARYLFKHQNFEAPEPGETDRYAEGLEIACDVLSSLLEEAADEARAKPLREE